MVVVVDTIGVVVLVVVRLGVTGTVVEGAIVVVLVVVVVDVVVDAHVVVVSGTVVVVSGIVVVVVGISSDTARGELLKSNTFTVTKTVKLSAFRVD